MFILKKEELTRLQEIEFKRKQDLKDIQAQYNKRMQEIENEYEYCMSEVLKPCVDAFIKQADNLTLYRAIINSICADVVWQHTIINIDKKHPELGNDRKTDFDIDDNWYNLYFLYMLTDELASNRGEEGKQLSLKLEPLYIKYGQGRITKEKAEKILKDTPARFTIID